MVSETVVSGSESTSRLLFLHPLPRKEMRSKATRVFTNDVLCSDHSTLALALFTSQALEAPRALLLNLLFWWLTKGPEVKAEMLPHLPVFRGRQRLLCHPCSAHRSVLGRMHQKSPPSEPISPRETSSLRNPQFKYIKVLIYIEG